MRTLGPRSRSAWGIGRRTAVAVGSMLLVVPVCSVLLAPSVGAAVAPSVAAADVGTSLLEPGATLASGSSMASPNGQYQLAMQGDGNLVVYAAYAQRYVPLWDSATNCSPGASAVMQGDGNLVVYSTGGRALWASGTEGHPGAFAAIQSDGNLVIYGADGTALADTGSILGEYAGTSLPTGAELEPGQFLASPGGKYFAQMQTNGNFVVSLGGFPYFDSGTAGHPGAYLVMQGDGNLVVYPAGGGPALWSSGTAGTSSNASLATQDDGNLVIYGTPTAPPRANITASSTTALFSLFSSADAITRSALVLLFVSLVMSQNITVQENIMTTTATASGTLNTYYQAMQQVTSYFAKYGTTAGAVNVFKFLGASMTSSVPTGLNELATPSVLTSMVTELPADESLLAGDFELVMQPDGNLVLYRRGQTAPLWQSGTAGHRGAYLSKQSDGNVVVYLASGTALWETGTNGNPGDYLVLQSDGNVVVYSASGTALWSSGSRQVVNPQTESGLLTNLAALLTAANSLNQSQQSTLQLQTNALTQTYALVNNIASLIKSLIP